MWELENRLLSLQMPQVALSNKVGKVGKGVIEYQYDKASLWGRLKRTVCSLSVVD